MPQRLLDHNQDLRRLVSEGYDVEVCGAHLLVKDVPYVNAKSEIARGILVSTLNLAGDTTVRPDTHVAYFAGDHPCHADGSTLSAIQHSSGRQQLTTDVTVDHSFSAKPPSGAYADYYDKMVTYINIVSGPARVLDPSATALTFPVIEPADTDSVFNYLDTASSRAQIESISQKLAVERIAIIGLGGTGSYVLDLLAKVPAKEIHLFDGDVELSHNAFRAPGAPSVEELRAKPYKVVYLHRVYSKMHRGIVVHPEFVDATNVEQLRGMTFCFLCLDSGPSKKLIVDALELFGVSFVDVGMGVTVLNNSLRGSLRVTSSTPNARTHFRSHVSLVVDDEPNDYNRNIQVADLNALNAALAVIKWKKILGFYCDVEREHQSVYVLDSNALINSESTA